MQPHPGITEKNLKGVITLLTAGLACVRGKFYGATPII